MPLDVVSDAAQRTKVVFRNTTITALAGLLCQCIACTAFSQNATGTPTAVSFDVTFRESHLLTTRSFFRLFETGVGMTIRFETCVSSSALQGVLVVAPDAIGHSLTVALYDSNVSTGGTLMVMDGFATCTACFILVHRCKLSVASPTHGVLSVRVSSGLVRVTHSQIVAGWLIKQVTAAIGNSTSGGASVELLSSQVTCFGTVVDRQDANFLGSACPLASSMHNLSLSFVDADVRCDQLVKVKASCLEQISISVVHVNVSATGNETYPSILDVERVVAARAFARSRARFARFFFALQTKLERESSGEL